MIPKSLHTVTALVNVARELRLMGVDDPIGTAASVLGYSRLADPYGLCAKAEALLNKTVCA